MPNRRAFIKLLGGAPLVWPLAVAAQKRAVIGFLSSNSLDHQQDRLQSLRQGLGELGYIEGQNLTIEYRWAEGRNDRLPELAADLVRRQVAVIVASDGPNTARPAYAATKTIPIIYQTGGDPVADGLVASMSRSGGNVTAVTRLSAALEPERLELLHAIAPGVTTVAVMLNPSSLIAESQVRGLQTTARRLGVELELVNASREADIAPAVAALDRRRVGALVIASDALFFGRTASLAALMQSHSLPTAYESREFVAAGGLISYGASLMDSYRQVGLTTGRILKGEKVSELPPGGPRKFELSFNLKSAQKLGLTIPDTLRTRADEVIE
jgi:ABC-type uncharacterized transport system substrate-binding protein